MSNLGHRFMWTFMQVINHIRNVCLHLTLDLISSCMPSIHTYIHTSITASSGSQWYGGCPRYRREKWSIPWCLLWLLPQSWCMFQSIFNVVLWSASALSQLSLYNTEFIVFFTSKLIFSPNEKPLAKKQHNTNTHGSCFVRGAGYRKDLAPCLLQPKTLTKD